MQKYTEMNKQELSSEKASLEKLFDDKKKLGLKLDISRGKPCPEQLDLSSGMLDMVSSRSESFKCENGFDIRNYGVIEGIPECRRLFGEILGAKAENVVVTGNSSLNFYYNIISHACTHKIPGSEKPWYEIPNRKLLCPTPGYDRHFAVGEVFGFELVTIPMKSDGSDMDMVEEYVKDPSVKGIVYVPKYSNPQGISASYEVVERFAKLSPAAPDFRIFWDNAYVVHHIYPDTQMDEVPSLLELAEKYGNEDMVYMFGSTSKITYPSGGLAAACCSKNNVEDIKSMLSLQNIGPDKVNQMRHALFFKNLDGVLEHMKKHAEIVRPKFEALEAGLEKGLGETGIASWNKPHGGYFLTADIFPGTAKRTVALCKEAGLTITGAGSVFPYGKDPKDSVLRIAPTYAPLSEISDATEIFCISARLAAVEKLLAEV